VFEADLRLQSTQLRGLRRIARFVSFETKVVGIVERGLRTGFSEYVMDADLFLMEGGRS